MIYINPLTVLEFVVFYFSGNGIYFLICYLSMFLHELAHLVFALIIGLVPEKISLQPYGVCLTLKNKIIYSYIEEAVLYLSGPCMNIVLALVSLVFFGRGRYSDYFYVCNLVLFFMNIIPVKPLDGGILLNKTLTRAFGVKTARKISLLISGLFFLVFLIIGVYVIIKTGFNTSVLIMSALLFVNMFSQDEKYSVDFLREFLFYKEKKEVPLCTKTKIIVADKDYNSIKIAENFKYGIYTIVFIKEHGKVKEIKTESEIIDEFLS